MKSAADPVRTLATGAVERIRSRAAPLLRDAVDDVRRREPMLGRIIGYHLGFNDAEGRAEEGDRGGLGGALCLAALAAETVGAGEDEAMACALAFELAKDFTQLQDDIIDNDLMRRERPSAWSVFGIPMTLLAANAALAAALEPFSGYGARGTRAMRHLLAAIDTCTVGQAQDLQGASRPLSGAEALSIEEFRTIAGNKTCSLLSAALTLGAVLTRAPKRVVNQLNLAGRHIGLAWQVLDDALDLWAPDGSPSYNDLREGKRSFPILVALGANRPERDALLHLLAAPRREEWDLREAARLIELLGGKSAAEHETFRNFENAVRTIHKLPFAGRARDELIAVVSLIGLRGANRTATIATPAIVESGPDPALPQTSASANGESAQPSHHHAVGTPRVEDACDSGGASMKHPACRGFVLPSSFV